MTTIILAVLIGLAFGIVLDLIGATNPNLIVKMLNFFNLHLMKTILLAIGFASILMFGGQKLGLVDVGHMSVKTAYLGVLIGGLFLGFGWALSGYCPGTGASAAASGRKDAILFVIGGLVGAAAYMQSYSYVKSTGLLAKILGGKATLGTIPGADYVALFPSIAGDTFGLAVGVLFILIATILPGTLAKS